MTYIPRVGLTWEEIEAKLETEGSLNKSYDSDVDGVLNLGAIPTIPRTKLEYPTEDVSFAYLLAIDKAYDEKTTSSSAGHVTSDSFADKAVTAWVGSRYQYMGLVGRFTDFENRYWQYLYYNASTKDHNVSVISGGTETVLGYEAVDIEKQPYLLLFSISGSTLKSYRDDLTTPKISVTDTTFASGKFGVETCKPFAETHISTIGRLLAPSSSLPRSLAIIEMDQLKQNLVEISQLNNIPDFLKQEAKKYEFLKAKGFTDDEIKELFGEIQTHVDLASVTWGTFDHKPEHNTMLITITTGNPYTSEKAITEQIEHAKSKGLKVLSPPRDYSEAIEQYRQLKQEFTEWIAGKDNYAYQTLGHEGFESFQVADTYYGNIVEGYKPDAYRNVPDWEMRRTLQMWKERLKCAEVVKSEAENHLKKLEEVEKKGW